MRIRDEQSGHVQTNLALADRGEQHTERAEALHDLGERRCRREAISGKVRASKGGFSEVHGLRLLHGSALCLRPSRRVFTLSGTVGASKLRLTEERQVCSIYRNVDKLRRFCQFSGVLRGPRYAYVCGGNQVCVRFVKLFSWNAHDPEANR